MKRVVLTLALVVLLVTSGCLGLLTGEGSSFEAKPVSVSEEATAETGYSKFDSGSNTVTRSFAGQQVRVQNTYAEYARTSSLPLFDDTKVARFTVFASPEVKVAGQSFNPLAKMNNTEIVLRLQSQYDTLSGMQKVSDRQDTVLGIDTKVSKFRANSRTQAGTQTEVFIHITKVKHQGDFVLALGVYPAKMDGEQSNVNRMLAGIQHG